MPTAFRIQTLRIASAALAAATLVTATAPAMAQDSAGEVRIRKIEAEVRALQRKVFPGGDGRFFEPQIGPGGEGAQASTTPSITAPSNTAVTDILVRLDALETQLRALTARSEEQANTLTLLDERVALLETTRASGGELPPLPTPASAQSNLSVMSDGAAPAPSSAPTTTSASAATKSPVPATASPPVAAPTPARLAAVQAIAKPQTEDAGDDEYSYGFRLWSAGFYPEARQQLTKFVEQHPNHSRISFGRNLLGRAFLDDNLAEDAARWFLRNYQANKNGDRAPDSLLYLGASMIAMKDTKRACIALAEFAETYPLIASGRLANDYQANRAKVTCS